MAENRPAVPRNGEAHEPEVDPEVRPLPKRRTFSAEYKLRILAEIDRCRKPGETGAVLRREGLYTSHLVEWRRQRALGELTPGAGDVRGGKPTPEAEALVQLQRENERLRAQLTQAELIIGAQKKLAQALEHALHDGNSSSS
jgi:transposase